MKTFIDFEENYLHYVDGWPIQISGEFLLSDDKTLEIFNCNLDELKVVCSFGDKAPYVRLDSYDATVEYLLEEIETYVGLYPTKWQICSHEDLEHLQQSKNIPIMANVLSKLLEKETVVLTIEEFITSNKIPLILKLEKLSLILT